VAESSVPRRPDPLADCPLAPGVPLDDPRAKAYRALFVLDVRHRLGHLVDMVIMVAILANVSVLTLATWEPARIEAASLLRIVDWVTTGIFIVEYIIRAWCVTVARDYRHPVWGRLRYCLTFFAIINLLAILPPFLLLAGINASGLQTLRLLRLLKLIQHSVAVQSLLAVFVRRHAELLGAFLVIGILLLIASSAIYIAEHEAQPEHFGSIPESMWWSVVTITTVGYGDVVPVTTAGRIVASFVAVVGLLAVAIPTGIVGAGFYEEFTARRHGHDSDAP
jgi:voltage-gated potassium channel